jgi:L-iditol 2-dehydrogenase
MCREGATVFGANGNGGHARYMKVPVSTLVPLPDSLSFETGAAISCGTGTAWGALKRLGLEGGETIAIFGQGPVGLSATQLAVAMGARVIALDISPERRKLAEEFGADAVIDARRGRAQDARHIGRCGSAGRRRARNARVGHGVLRRRARAGDARC